jgi:hypothetical protein
VQVTALLIRRRKLARRGLNADSGKEFGPFHRPLPLHLLRGRTSFLHGTLRSSKSKNTFIAKTQDVLLSVGCWYSLVYGVQVASL